MATQAEMAFTEETGRHFARMYGVSPAVGRVAGWLLICDPISPTAGDIARELGMSRSGVGTAIHTLEQWKFARRSRPSGERADRITISPDFDAQLEAPSEYSSLGELIKHGLEVLDGTALERRARLLELQAFNDFLEQRMPSVAAEWREHRAALRASGTLPI